MRFALFPTAIVLTSFVACRTGPRESEPDPANKEPAATATAAKRAAPPPPTIVPPPSAVPRESVVPTDLPPQTAPISPDDPLKGVFTIVDATKGLKGTGAIVAKIDTSKGAIQCKLYDDKAPNTVANFIGLATGKRTWKDPKGGKWVTKPAYDGTTFHRIIKEFMIQGGDALGNGSGEPGYVIADENPAQKHDRAGLLAMANRGPNTNGAQFFIQDAPAGNLDQVNPVSRRPSQWL